MLLTKESISLLKTEHSKESFEFENNMKAAGKNLVTHKYEAGHGFANPSNPSFKADAAADSYSKAIAFLKAH